MDHSNRFMMFLMFFSIAMSIYGSVNYYILKRGWQCLPDNTRLKRGYICFSLLIVISYILGRTLMGLRPSYIGEVLMWIGSAWIGVMVYLFFMTIIIDLVRLGNLMFHYFPAGWKQDLQRIRIITMGIVLTVAVGAVIIGFIVSLFVRLRNVDIEIKGKTTGLDTLRIAVASDFHLGAVVGPKRLRNIVDIINTCDADIVLLAGDIVDEGIHSEYTEEFCRELKRIKGKRGVYAAAGNHEYIVGIEKTVPFLQKCGITVLQDQAVKIGEEFYLAGRNDIGKQQFMGEPRLRLSAILHDLNKELPIILMDHTPHNLKEAEENGVDLQVSGHTHHGQMFPFNYITNMIFEHDWGYYRRGGTHFYISCGAGTWGPPVRTNSMSEVVCITVTFK